MAKTRANLLLASGTDAELLSKQVAAITGVKELVAVFPDEADDELRRMYIVDLDPEHAREAVDAIGSLAGVEDVELAPVRRHKHAPSKGGTRPL